MNIRDIYPYTNEWLRVLLEWKKGDTIRKADLLEALKSQPQPPAEAVPLLVEIVQGVGVKGGYKFRRGPQKHQAYKKPHWIGLQLMVLEELIKDPSGLDDVNRQRYFAQFNRKINAKHRTRVSAKDSAKAILAEQLGISVRTLETIISSK